jgi:hypothetical protein
VEGGKDEKHIHVRNQLEPIIEWKKREIVGGMYVSLVTFSGSELKVQQTTLELVS